MGFDWDRHLDKDFLQALPRGTVKQAGRGATGWIEVGFHRNYSESVIHGSTNAILVDPEYVRPHQFGHGWIGADLGRVTRLFGETDSITTGLAENTEEGDFLFFCDGHKPPGASIYQVFISLPFLWFWDAFQAGDDWHYLTPGGNERELVRVTANESSWRVEIRAEELGTFLHAIQQKLVVQLERFKSANQVFEPLEVENLDEWGGFKYSEFSVPDSARRMYKRLDGYFYIKPKLGESRPQLLRWEDEEDYGSFIFDVDEDGDPKEFTCDPALLNNYFGANPDNPDYLTPVYFRSDVLNKYSAVPSRYAVTTTRLECMSLWGLDISFNECNLVVVYLGDIGAKIPSEEHPHWRNHNVLPEGGIDEGRLRRDFLGQWVSSPDPITDLQHAVRAVNEKSKAILGFTIWREPHPQLLQELGALVAPSSADLSSLTYPVITLTKWLVDSLNVEAIKGELEPEEIEARKHLQNLKRALEKNDWPTNWIKDFHLLQSLRSRGGIAHLPNSSSAKALKDLGGEGLDARKDFQTIVKRLKQALDSLLTELRQSA